MIDVMSNIAAHTHVGDNCVWDSYTKKIPNGEKQILASYTLVNMTSFPKAYYMSQRYREFFVTWEYEIQICLSLYLMLTLKCC